VVFVSENSQEHVKQQEAEGDTPPLEAASQHEPAADAPDDRAVENSDTGDDRNEQAEDTVADGDDSQEAVAPEASEQSPVVADIPNTEAAPELPEADASSTVGDAPSQPVAEEAIAEEAIVEQAVVEQAVVEQGSAETDEMPAPKKKPKKAKVDPSKVQPLEEIPEEELEEQESLDRDWYILKVQSNREKSIREALERRVKVAGLDRFFGDVIVPTEDVAEYKNGKRKVTKRKLWPGYIVVNMAINDDTWFLVRETPGIGDFTGSIGKPTPMMPDEVERIMPKETAEPDDEQQIKIGIRFKPGDRVRVKDGHFQNFEGDVESIDEANGRVTVICSIFGRSTPVELEHWQIEDL
jgi:transcriptional antiterminator NusG